MFFSIQFIRTPGTIEIAPKIMNISPVIPARIGYFINSHILTSLHILLVALLHI